MSHVEAVPGGAMSSKKKVRAAPYTEAAHTPVQAAPPPCLRSGAVAPNAAGGAAPGGSRAGGSSRRWALMELLCALARGCATCTAAASSVTERGPPLSRWRRWRTSTTRRWATSTMGRCGSLFPAPHDRRDHPCAYHAHPVESCAGGIAPWRRAAVVGDVSGGRSALHVSTAVCR